MLFVHIEIITITNIHGDPFACTAVCLCQFVKQNTIFFILLIEERNNTLNLKIKLILVAIILQNEYVENNIFSLNTTASRRIPNTKNFQNRPRRKHYLSTKLLNVNNYYCTARLFNKLFDVIEQRNQLGVK